MIRRLRPELDELAVFLVDPGDSVVVETERGPHVVKGADPTDPYPEVKLSYVARDPERVGHGQVVETTWGCGPGGAKTPTGLRMTALRRYCRGHKQDEQVWEHVRTLLGGSLRACYVRIERVPYYGRTRWAATVARTAHGPALPDPEPDELLAAVVRRFAAVRSNWSDLSGGELVLDGRIEVTELEARALRELEGID